MHSNDDYIKKETFVNADDKTFRALLYDMLSNVQKRMSIVEHSKPTKTFYATTGGIIGGIIAVVGKSIIHLMNR